MVRLLAVLSICLLLTVIHSNDKLSYLAYLLQQKSSLQQNVKQILSISNNAEINLKASDSQLYQQKLLNSAIRDQSQLIIQAISHTFISINKKIGNCTNDNSNQQSNSKLKTIQNQLKKIEGSVNSQPPCQRNDQIKRNFLFYKTISDGLTLEINNQCQITPNQQQNNNIPFLNIKDTKFIPNTQTNQAWIYGQITPQQLKDKKTQLITVYGAASCPENSPFLDDSNNCEVCANNTVYDISLKKCIVCDNETSYNKDLHACTKYSRFNSNITNNLNFIGKVPAFNSQINSCPQDKPFFDNKSCISCSLPSYFSFNSSSCEACALGSVFEIKSQQCIVTSFFLSNLTGIESYIGSPLSPLPYDNIKTCPSEHPFSNGKQCISCGLLQFFNFQKMKCQSCPQLYHFDPNTRSCTSLMNIFINSNLISNRNFNGKVPFFNNLFKSCEQSTPFFNGTQCISCVLPSYFDFSTSTCMTCSQGLTFNIVIQTCEYIKQNYYTDLESKSIYYNGNFEDIKNLIDRKKSNFPDIQICQNSTPYYNSRNNSCISCTNQQPLFDFKNNQCMKCPQGSEFEEQSHICLTKSLSATIERMIMNTS